MCTHRVARRPADAADLEARPARHRRDDTREGGPGRECKECGAGRANEHESPEEPSRTVPARFRNRVGLLFDGLGRVQRPDREGDGLGGQNVALFFFGFISMFNGVAPTPSAFRVEIKFQALTPSTRRRPRDCVCKVAIPRHRCDVVRAPCALLFIGDAPGAALDSNS